MVMHMDDRGKQVERVMAAGLLQQAQTASPFGHTCCSGVRVTGAIGTEHLLHCCGDTSL
jgi:hypothetical protein